MKKIISLVLSLLIMITVIGVLPMNQSVSASSSSPFYFKNTMSEEVLKNYLSRAVTLSGLCGSGSEQNMLFEEDMRMILRTGAKFISRAAAFAWDATAPEQVSNHYVYAEKMAKKVHEADSEIILQAFVAEIVRKSYVEKIEIPEWVFTAFGKTPEKRNFRFADIINKEKGEHFWGAGTYAGYPDWSREEAQMWYYYCIRRYIDIGYESIHIQEGADSIDDISVYKVLNMCREYAKTHARRGLVLFHSFFDMVDGGSKMGNNLIFDIQGNGLVPNETVEEDGILKCRIGTPDDFWCTWFGRSTGGVHPLGFTTEICPTILEFDNYGQTGTLGVSNGEAFGTWGYDDITWFATQPEDYRNEFLLYLDDYMKKNGLTKDGKQAYFPVYPMRRTITPQPNYPETVYTPGESYSDDFLFAYAESGENIQIDIIDGTIRLTTRANYRANRQSDGCPNGFNQEDTIRQIFLGKDAEEDPELLKVVIPSEYLEEEDEWTTPAGQTSSKATANTSSKKNNTTANNTTTGSTANTASVTSTASEATGSEEVLTTESEETTSAELISSDMKTDADKPKGSALPWIIGGIVAASALLIGGGCVFYFLYRKNKNKSTQ